MRVGFFLQLALATLLIGSDDDDGGRAEEHERPCVHCTRRERGRVRWRAGSEQYEVRTEDGQEYDGLRRAAGAVAPTIRGAWCYNGHIRRKGGREEKKDQCGIGAENRQMWRW